MGHRLGGGDGADSRNGQGRKTVLAGAGQVRLEVPRDRQAGFDPQLIARHQLRFPGL